MADVPQHPEGGGDLSVTALYTAATWNWAGIPGADVLHTPGAQRVFGATNRVLDLLRWFVRGRPSLRHELVHRHVIIDQVVEDTEATLVIELAAGLSPRGGVVAASRDLTYVEVDLPGMVTRKEQILAETPAGRAILDHPRLRRVAADVTETPLADLHPIEGPTVVVAEGLMMYLERDVQVRLFGAAAEALAEHGGTFVFDLVPRREQPPTGAIGRFLGWWLKRFTGGRGFVEDDRTRHDLLRDLRRAGFDEAVVLDSAEVAVERALPFADVSTHQLVFVATKQAARPS